VIVRDKEERNMPKAKKGTEFVCEVCGTTLAVTEEGVGLLEDVVCCERPMEPRVSKPKKKNAKAKKKAAKKWKK
jgi:hypothetical protein